MPMIYYILRDASGNNWKERSIRLTVSKIKKYLGMLEFSGAELIKEAYPKFSQFKKNVLDNSVADINRLKQLGQIDVCVSYEPIYNGKRKVGNPAFIEFTVYDTIEQMLKAGSQKQQTQHSVSLFAEAEEVKSKPGEKEWQQLVAALDGDIAEQLKKVEFVSYDGNTVIVRASDEQRLKVENCLTEEILASVNNAFKRAYGKSVALKYLPKK